MIRNYIKIAFRNLLKYKLISFINLFGLTVGLACCLLIFTYIIHEVSYDKYNKNADNIYRLERTFINAETGVQSLELGSVAPPVAPLLLNDFKEIKKITRLLSNGTTSFRYNDKIFNETNVYFADEHLFDVFDVNVKKGNPGQALLNPFSVMVSEEIAEKYFGKEDPMEKTIKLDGTLITKVTGVFKKFPYNSHVHPEILISFNTLNDTAVYGARQLATNWGNNSFFTYLLLPPQYDPKKLEAQFPAFLNRHIKTEGPKKPSTWTTLSLKPLTDIHLHSKTDLELEQNSDINRVYIFSAIALFILMIASINYMNLSTARSALRAKEIGVRKVVGARKHELIAQFISESIVISYAAMILAIIVTACAMPALNNILGQELSLKVLLGGKAIVMMLLVPAFVGVVSGLYPALFLSSFQPIHVLKGVLKIGGGSISFRKVLVVLQFAVSIVLIVSTVVVYRQLNYMQHKSLGFNREQVINMGYQSALADRYASFRTELLANALIKSVGRSSRIPTGRLLDASGSQINLGDSLAPTKADIKLIRTDEAFIPTYGIKMVAGRNFSNEYGRDTTAYLINEAAVKVLGLKRNEDAIGKQFQYGPRKGELVGVFQDFHFESLHQHILPMVFQMPATERGYGQISIKLSGQDVKGAVGYIERVWKKFLPETPFEYTFLDESYDRLYEAEERQATIFTIFAFIAIFIGCLGLFGLSAFAISQRVKEIGIRKVLGANVSTIVGLLSRDFLKLVFIAGLMACPLAYYGMHQWLQDFAYRINIPWWVYVLAGVTAAVIAFVTISYQAVRAAVANPVNSLRNE